MKYDGFIFDIDGVLLDTSRSFNSAIVEAVAFATNSNRFTFEEIALLKSIRGFNNDWHVAVAGAGWVQYNPAVAFESFVQELDRLGGGLAAVKQVIPELTEDFERYLTRLAQEAYGGTTACRKLYGFDPEFIKGRGWWQTEKPTITSVQMEPILEKTGIVTGRNEAETNLAFDLLGWQLPYEVVAYSDDPSLDKPNPTKLKRIIDNLGCKHPVYVGDGRDDLELVKNYRNATQRFLDFCLIRSNNNIQEYNLIVESISDLFEDQGTGYG